MKKDRKALIDEMDKARLCRVTEESTWRHYKGTIYRVLELGFDCNTNEMVVIYQESNDNHTLYPITFTRPYSEWHDEIEEGIRRFEYVDARIIYMSDKEYREYYK